MSNKIRKKVLEKDRKERRKDAISHGIYKILIKPLLELRPDFYEREKWLSHVMDVENRPIEHYKSRASFRLPGSLMITHAKENATPSESERFIKRDQVVCIRLDKNTPDRVEIEIVDNPRSVRETTRLFRLTDRQWTEVHHNFIPYIPPYKK